MSTIAIGTYLREYCTTRARRRLPVFAASPPSVVCSTLTCLWRKTHPRQLHKTNRNTRDLSLAINTFWFLNQVQKQTTEKNHNKLLCPHNSIACTTRAHSKHKGTSRATYPACDECGVSTASWRRPLYASVSLPALAASPAPSPPACFHRWPLWAAHFQTCDWVNSLTSFSLLSPPRPWHAKASYPATLNGTTS